MDYNMIYFWTLTFPLATIASIATAGYIGMKQRYVECRLKYDAKFRASKKGQRWLEKLDKRNIWYERFRYREMDLGESSFRYRERKYNRQRKDYA